MKKTFGFESLILGMILLFTLQVSAQDFSYENGKRYTLAGLEVTGVKSYNEQTVKTFTGLRIGQQIKIPSDDIADVIKKLMKLELFSNAEFYITDIQDDNVYLELRIEELPSLNEVTIYGVKKKKVDGIIKDTELKKGKKITESFIANTKNYLENKYRKQGFLNTRVTIATAPTKNDSIHPNAVDMVLNIKRGSKVKVKNISFDGNEQLTDKSLRKALKNTKKKMPLRFWKKSKYIEQDYNDDMSTLIEKYAERGYRDARVTADTITDINDKNIAIKINVEEGDKYYFGEIDFIGNSVYSDRQLARILGIKKGEVYNGVKLKKRIQDNSDPDANDLTNLYQNSGYMFSQVNPVEVSAVNDTIDFEIRIIEGKETFLDHVTVVGNDRTNDHVIYRELRTKPGERYDKSKIIRTIRELSQLGFFDAESITPNIQNPDPNAGTLDIEYSVQESGSSQIELQGGYGGGGFIGTLGLSFSNFAIKDIFDKEAYKPVPMGDGQTFSLRLQASRTFRTYSFSFAEPWWGGEKPVRFSVSLSRTQQFLFNFATATVDRDRQFSITGVTVGLAKRLSWPDDYFSLSHALSFQNYNLKNYNTGLFTFGDGSSNSFAYTVALSRNNTYNNPIFPVGGSEFTLSAKVTPPYSLFDGNDYKELSEDRETAVANGDTDKIGEIDQERFRWLEYYKVKFKGAWYTSLVDKFVLKTQMEMGILGAYNQYRGVVPFERFFVGGDGLGNFTLDGREMVQLRGYENQSINETNDGSAIYNKFSIELRYPLTLKPSASIYMLSFFEAGNAFNNFSEFNPFQLKRSAGVGLRIFMPAFGLLGIDFGYGMDDVPLRPGEKSGWQTHFIIGQQF